MCLVDDGHGRLGDLGIVPQADEPRYSERLATFPVDAHERLVVVAVDVAEVRQVRRGEVRLGDEEATVARLVAEALEHAPNRLVVVPSQPTDDRRSPVAKS